MFCCNDDTLNKRERKRKTITRGNTKPTFNSRQYRLNKRYVYCDFYNWLHFNCDIESNEHFTKCTHTHTLDKKKLTHTHTRWPPAAVAKMNKVRSIDNTTIISIESTICLSRFHIIAKIIPRTRSLVVIYLQQHSQQSSRACFTFHSLFTIYFSFTISIISCLAKCYIYATIFFFISLNWIDSDLSETDCDQTDDVCKCFQFEKMDNQRNDIASHFILIIWESRVLNVGLTEGCYPTFFFFLIKTFLSFFCSMFFFRW